MAGVRGTTLLLLVFGALVCLVFVASTGSASCQCRSGNCAAESDCPDGCKMGYGTPKDQKLCSKKTAGKTCYKNRTELEACKTCEKPKLDGKYCVRENLAYSGESGKTLQNGQTNETCKSIPREITIELNEKREGSFFNAVIEVFVANKSEKLKLGNCSINVKHKSKESENEQMSICSNIYGHGSDLGSYLVKCKEKFRKPTALTLTCKQPVCLTEIKFYYCRNFWWGPETRCTTPCNCANGARCNRWTGGCGTNGCANGFYGPGCNSTCSCGVGRPCDKRTGKCSESQVSTKPTTTEETFDTDAPRSKLVSSLTSLATISETSPATTSQTVASTKTSTMVAGFSTTHADTGVASVTVESSGKVIVSSSSHSVAVHTDSKPATLSLSTVDTGMSTIEPASSSIAETDLSSTGIVSTSFPPPNPSVLAAITVHTPGTTADSAASAATLSVPNITDTIISTTTTAVNESAETSPPKVNFPTSSESESITGITLEPRITNTSISTTPTAVSKSTETSPPTVSFPSSSGSGSVTGITLVPNITNTSISTKATVVRDSTESFLPTITFPTSSESKSTAGFTPTRRSTTAKTTSPPIAKTSSAKITPTKGNVGFVSTTAHGVHVSRKAGGKLSESSSPGDEDDSDAIVGGLFGAAACVLVVVAVLVVFLWRNEQRQPNKSADELFIDGEQGVDSSRQGLALLSIGTNITLKPASLSALYANSTQEASAGSEHYANFDQSFVPTVDPVPVGNFRNYMSYMQNVGGYAKEFRALPKEILGPQEAANDPLVDSSKKNRFKDICPYDNNRVVLMKMKDTDSDFINASYIGGFAESMAYIAAQGPMPSTVDDFWHMIWVEGCGKIVMLTSLFEQGKVKCERYWPSEEKRTQTYGQYVVTLQKTMTRAFFKQHTLKVTKSVLQNEDGDASRQINHFHFTAWPDHGVPSAPAFVEFWEFVQHIPSRLPGPLLVHCSAGVGRTGTYIALDILAHQADIMGKVSIFPTVRRLRRERVKMVQALSQYIFLHEGVAEVLESRDFYVFLYDLRDNSDWSPSPGTWHLADAVRPKFVSQFQKLASLRPVLSKTDTETALLPENVSKNRFAHILPGIDVFC